MRFAPGTDPEVIRRAEEAFYGKRRQDQPMQAALSAQQALPQPQMPPELQRLQDMSNALGKKIQSDPFMQRYQEQQRQLQSGIQQKTQNYVNSLQQFLNTAPPEFRQFLSSPQTLSRLGMAYQEQLPEMKQIQNIAREMRQYHQNTYGQEIQKIQQFQMQALPQIQQYQNQLFNQQQQAQGTPPPPGGYTPTSIDPKVRQDLLERVRPQPEVNPGRTTQGGFGGIGQGVPVSTSLGNSMFNQDANYVIKGDKLYKDGKWIGSLGGGMMGGGNAGQNQIVMGNDAVVDVPDWVFETAERQEPDPVVQTPSTPGLPRGTLYDIMTGGLGSSQPKDVIPRPKPSVNPGMVTPKFEPPTPSIIQDPRRTPKPPTGVPQVPKVPKRPTRGSPTGTPKAPVKTKPLGGTKPRPKPIERGQESTGPAVKGVMAPKPVRKPPTMPNVDPERIKTTAPKKPKGLGNRPKNPNVPSAFQGVNTNINRQRQDMR